MRETTDLLALAERVRLACEAGTTTLDLTGHRPADVTRLVIERLRPHHLRVRLTERQYRGAWAATFGHSTGSLSMPICPWPPRMLGRPVEVAPEPRAPSLEDDDWGEHLGSVSGA